MKTPALATAVIFALALTFAVVVPPRVRANGGRANAVSPSHPLIRYTGRFDKSDPENIRFDWPGSTVELRFGGTSCAVEIRGDGGLYNVYVNDSMTVTRFDTLLSTRQLARGLADTIHYLRITKRFEGRSGHIAEIKAFRIDAGRSLFPLDPPPARRIEFIGGSNLIGFGVEANTLTCADPSRFSNSELAFGTIAARALGAEHHIIAMSGKGLVRNWQSPFINSQRTFGHYYKRTLRGDPASRWDFSEWTPDVAVTYFGTNDFSTRPHPPKDLYTAMYRNFIEGIQMRSGAHVVCVVSSREPVRTYVRELVEQMRRGGNRRVHFYSFGTVPTAQLGCDWHPGKEAQRKIGLELADVIRPLLK